MLLTKRCGSCDEDRVDASRSWRFCASSWDALAESAAQAARQHTQDGRQQPPGQTQRQAELEQYERHRQHEEHTVDHLLRMDSNIMLFVLLHQGDGLDPSQLGAPQSPCEYSTACSLAFTASFCTMDRYFSTCGLTALCTSARIGSTFFCTSSVGCCVLNPS
jgi:hypothetical protein